MNPLLLRAAIGLGLILSALALEVDRRRRKTIEHKPPADATGGRRDPAPPAPAPKKADDPDPKRPAVTEQPA
jgi:hypothetical protein